MLISTQNHVTCTMPKQTTFRGDFTSNNVDLVAREGYASFYNDFDPSTTPKDGITPAQQITDMRLPGGEDFKVRFEVRPSLVQNAKVIAAIASINGDSAEGLATHLHAEPEEFGKNIIGATQKAANALANCPVYVAKRIEDVQKAYMEHGTKITGLGEVCDALFARDKHDFLTRLKDAVAKTKGAVKVKLSMVNGRLLAIKDGYTKTIGLPIFGIRRTEGQILADRLLKILC